MLLPSLWSLTHYTWIPIRCSERHDAKGFWTQTRQLKFELRRQNPRWPAMKLNSFHCSFHAFSLGSTKTSASQFQDNARGNWWCNNPTLMHQWCYLWLVSWFQLLSFGSNKKKCQKPPLGRSLLQPGLCFSCDSNFLASTFHRTNSCASGASSGVYHLIPEWYDCNHGES